MFWISDFKVWCIPKCRIFTTKNTMTRRRRIPWHICMHGRHSKKSVNDRVCSVNFELDSIDNFGRLSYVCSTTVVRTSMISESNICICLNRSARNHHLRSELLWQTARPNEGSSNLPRRCILMLFSPKSQISRKYA